MHVFLLGVEIFLIWLLCIAVPLALWLGPRLRDRQPADHCKHTRTPGGNR
jgi:hypothetical protein